jgi:hypothetical protein
MKSRVDYGPIRLAISSLRVDLTDDQIFQIIDASRSKDVTFEQMLRKAEVNPRDFLHLLQTKRTSLTVIINLQKELGLEFITPIELEQSIDQLASQLKSELC